MKKLLYLAFLISAGALAQVSSPSVQYVSTAPSGSCSEYPPIQVLQTTGDVYGCVNGSWAKIGGAGGATLPFPGVVCGTSGTAGTVCTPQQLQTASASGLFGLIDTTNLIGLYVFSAADYAGGSGTVLHDVSGNGNNCTIPTSSGAPTWVVDGSVYALSWPGGTTGAATNFLNCPGIVSPTTMQAIINSQPQTATYPTLFGYSSAGNPSGFFYGFTFAVQTTIDPGILLATSGQSATTTTWNDTMGAGYHMVTYSTVTPSASLDDHLPSLFGSLSTPNPIPLPAGGNLLIGGSQTPSGCSGACYLKAPLKLYGVAVYGTTPLTQAQINQNYAAWQSRFTAQHVPLGTETTNLATVTPYNLVIGETSIEAGYSSNTPPATQLTLGANWTVTTVAVPSQSTGVWLKTTLTTAKMYFNPNAGTNIFYLGSSATNDLCETVPAVAPATAYGYLNAAVQGLKSLGYQVVVGTNFSRSGNGAPPNAGSTCDVLMEAANTYILGNSTAQGFYVSDIAAFPGFGAAGAYANPTSTCGSGGTSACFLGDGIHPTAAGQLTYAKYIQSQLLSITGFNSANPNSQAGSSYAMTSADNYILAPITGAATWTLPDCTGLTGNRYKVTNTSAASILTVSTVLSQTLVGSTTVSAATPSSFDAMRTSPTSSGCYWLRSQ